MRQHSWAMIWFRIWHDERQNIWCLNSMLDTCCIWGLHSASDVLRMQRHQEHIHSRPNVPKPGSSKIYAWHLPSFYAVFPSVNKPNPPRNPTTTILCIAGEKKNVVSWHNFNHLWFDIDIVGFIPEAIAINSRHMKRCSNMCAKSQRRRVEK